MNCKSLMFGGLLLLAGVGAADAAVVTGDLNLRSGPGTGYRVIDTMPAGSYVDVIGCTGAWCRVRQGAFGRAGARAHGFWLRRDRNRLSAQRLASGGRFDSVARNP